MAGSPPIDPGALARALKASIVSRALALADAPMRAAWLQATVRTHPIAPLAAALDLLCLDAEQAVPDAREVMMSLVQVVNDPAFDELAQRLREEASGRALASLARLLRRPIELERDDDGESERAREARVPDYGGRRPLTLGERKALARKPTRAAFDKLLRDPHPAVIHNLLDNPKLTEDDVVRLAARRPPRAEILTVVARSGRWTARPRVRMAVVLNPGAPPELAVPLVALLVRHELRLVLQMTDAHPAVRAAARELLLRRPPSLGRAGRLDGAG